MNIKQLKAAIANVPDHVDVCIKQTIDEYPISQVEKASVVKASYSEEPNGKVLAKDKVFLLTDDLFN